MILCSISGEIIRRYDSSNPDGVTHIGRIVPGEEHDDVEGLVEAFRLNPPYCLSVPSNETLADGRFKSVGSV